MADGKVVGLDIGTSMIRVAIGELDPDTGNIRIAGTASRKSAGLRNGVIVNIEDAKNAIKETIDAAEQNDVRVKTSGNDLHKRQRGIAYRARGRSRDRALLQESRY